MEQKKLSKIIEKWDQKTRLVLEKEKIPFEELQCLLKESYKVLQFYCKDNLVPKEVSKLLLAMDEFLYFASVFEEKEVEINFYFYQIIYMIVEALKKGFFESKYECVFPVLQMTDLSNNLLVFDFENGHLEELL